jgi:NOL1/NOP2/fmu family ribosome biogenesis protein
MFSYLPDRAAVNVHIRSSHNGLQLRFTHPKKVRHRVSINLVIGLDLSVEGKNDGLVHDTREARD